METCCLRPWSRRTPNISMRPFCLQLDLYSHWQCKHRTEDPKAVHGCTHERDSLIVRYCGRHNSHAVIRLLEFYKIEEISRGINGLTILLTIFFLLCKRNICRDYYHESFRYIPPRRLRISPKFILSLLRISEGGISGRIYADNRATDGYFHLGR